MISLKQTMATASFMISNTKARMRRRKRRRMTKAIMMKVRKGKKKIMQEKLQVMKVMK